MLGRHSKQYTASTTPVPPATNLPRRRSVGAFLDDSPQTGPSANNASRPPRSSSSLFHCPAWFWRLKKTNRTIAAGDNFAFCTSLFVGLQGSGKTSIINNLLQEAVQPHLSEDATRVRLGSGGAVSGISGGLSGGLSADYVVFPTRHVVQRTLLSPAGIEFRFIDTPDALGHRGEWKDWLSMKVNSVLFVVDFSDELKLPLARQVLHDMASKAHKDTHFIIVASRQEKYPTINTVDGVRDYMETELLPVPNSVVLVSTNRSSMMSDTYGCSALLKWMITAMKLQVTFEGESASQKPPHASASANLNANLNPNAHTNLNVKGTKDTKDNARSKTPKHRW